MSAILGLTGLFCTKSLGKKDVRCLKELSLAVDKGGGRSEARRSGIGAEPVRKKGSPLSDWLWATVMDAHA